MFLGPSPQLASIIHQQRPHPPWLYRPSRWPRNSIWNSFVHMVTRRKQKSDWIANQMIHLFLYFGWYFITLCLAGKILTTKKSPSGGISTPKTPTTPPTCSFPLHSKQCAPPDITVGHNNGTKKDSAAGLLTPNTCSDGFMNLSFNLPGDPAIDSEGTHERSTAATAAAVSAAATAMASGLGSEFCCPSFGVRPPRLTVTVTSTNGDPRSATCSILWNLFTVNLVEGEKKESFNGWGI